MPPQPHHGQGVQLTDVQHRRLGGYQAPRTASVSAYSSAYKDKEMGYLGQEVYGVIGY